MSTYHGILHVLGHIGSFLTKLKSVFIKSLKEDIRKMKADKLGFISSLVKTTIFSSVITVAYVYLLLTSFLSFLLLHTSFFPVVILFVIVLVSIIVLLNKKSREKYSIAKYMILFIGAIISLQSVYPVLIPKTSFDNFETLGGIVEKSDNLVKYFIVSLVDVTVEPPLFPNVLLLPEYYGSTVELPLALNNLTEVPDYYKLTTPTLFSRIKNINNNTARFLVLTDGWKHKELKTRIKFVGDTYNEFSSYISYNPDSIGTIEIEYYKYYYSSITFSNKESFGVCFRNYEIIIGNNTGIFNVMNRIGKNISVSLCDKAVNQTRCDSIEPGFFENVKDLDKIKIEIKNTCLRGNETLDYYILVRPQLVPKKY